VAKRISPVEAVSRRRIQRQKLILLEAFWALPEKEVGGRLAGQCSLHLCGLGL
jgi:hypothetical protein